VLVLTSRAFDFVAKPLPDNVSYVGPQLDDPSWAEPWTSPWPADDTRPLLLVALSSTFQNQLDVLRRIVTATAALDVRTLVTTGPAIDPRDLPSRSPNVVVVRTAPHRAVLNQAAACLTHCGHGTTLKALAASVPLVCMPMGRDQND